MAGTYLMIAEKKIPEQASPESNKRDRTRTARSAPSSGGRQKTSKSDEAPVAHPPRTSENESARQPNLHLDIQIHIPADATIEQIDQIFASMAKHLYQR
jgi:hypothetical protein